MTENITHGTTTPPAAPPTIPNTLPTTAEELQRWTYQALGGSEEDTLKAGIPKFFRDGIIGGLLQALDSFADGTADSEEPEVIEMHGAAVLLRTLFLGDVARATEGQG